MVYIFCESHCCRSERPEDASLNRSVPFPHLAQSLPVCVWLALLKSIGKLSNLHNKSYHSDRLQKTKAHSQQAVANDIRLCDKRESILKQLCDSVCMQLFIYKSVGVAHKDPEVGKLC